MTPLDTVTLAKAVSAKALKAARPSLDVGDYNVDMIVRVAGTIRVEADTDRAPTASIPVLEVLKLFVAYSGVTGQHALDVLERALTDALAKSPRGEGAIAAAKMIDAAFARRVDAMIAKLPRTFVHGDVTSFLNVEVISHATREVNAAK